MRVRKRLPGLTAAGTVSPGCRHLYSPTARSVNAPDRG
jgi:hypothetical protein